MTDKFDLFGVANQPPTKLNKQGRRELLERQRASLLDILPTAMRETAVAREAAEPFEQAFWESHRELLLDRERFDAGLLTKPDLFASYDRRMLAGHEWHPYREKAKSCRAWLGEIQKELLVLNDALEKAA